MRAHRRIAQLNVEQLEKRLMLSCASAPAGLVGCWSGDGNTTDSINANDGILRNGAAYGDGQVDQSFSLDGMDDYVQINDTGSVNLDGFSELTISAWINPSEFVSFPNSDKGDIIVSKSNNGTGGDGVSYSLSALVPQSNVTTAVLRFSLFGDNGFVFFDSATDALEVGEWTHIVATWAGGQDMAVYLNSQQIPGTVNTSGVVTTMRDNDTPVNIGRLDGDSAGIPRNFFTGRIDEVEIYNHGLSEAEAQARFQAGLVTHVDIDVKPGSDPNSINVESNGQISVAVFTTVDFDATTIDASTVIFAGAYAIQSSLEDVDGDGDLDMVLHFRTVDTNLRELYDLLLIEDLNADGIIDSTRQVAEVSLDGQTLDDIIFQGIDEVDLLLRGKMLRDLLDELASAGAI